ncbi:MAG: hypothetical protein WAW59_06810 [Patescibacteria group bacterium]
MSSSFRSERISRHESRKSPFTIILQLSLVGIFVLLSFLYLLVKNTGDIEITPKEYIIDK